MRRIRRQDRDVQISVNETEDTDCKKKPLKDHQGNRNILIRF
jgi:hypothetical protein